MPRANRRTGKPHFAPSRVHAAAAARDIVITRRALHEGTRALPPDLIDIEGEIRALVGSLVIDEFEFAEFQTRQHGGTRKRSWVDVYRVDFENRDLWLKLKLEQDAQGDFVVVISLHEWDDTTPN